MLYPLKFQPALKFYPYGGRRFVEVSGTRPAARPRHRRVVGNRRPGRRPIHRSQRPSWPGRPCAPSCNTQGAALVGEEVHARYGDYFPLLIKFLDCGKRLPAHMHPSPTRPAQRVGPGRPRQDPRRGIWCGADAGRPGVLRGQAGADRPKSSPMPSLQGDTYDAVMKRNPDAHRGLLLRARRSACIRSRRGQPGLSRCNKTRMPGFGWDWAGFRRGRASISAERCRASHKELWRSQHALYTKTAFKSRRARSLLEDGGNRAHVLLCLPLLRVGAYEVARQDAVSRSAGAFQYVHAD